MFLTRNELPPIKYFWPVKRKNNYLNLYELITDFSLGEVLPCVIIFALCLLCPRKDFTYEEDSAERY